MAIRVRRWTQRTLLYPLAIFAIIAPTVVLGLFGAYALREIELRPSQDRQELQHIQASVMQALEDSIAPLQIEPPRGNDDVERVAAHAEAYFSDFDNAIASVCVAGRGKEILALRSLSATEGYIPPASLFEAISGMRARTPQGQEVTRAVTLPRVRDGGNDTWLIVFSADTDSFVAWRLMTVELRRITEAHLQTIPLTNDSLRAELVTRHDLNWQSAPESNIETLGFAPVHPGLFPDGYVALRIDTGRQFMKDDTLLSTLFIVIAVLCVPIVSSATLMVVHMILREASEARKKVDFVSNVTHELKTPLTSIRMFVETLALGRAKDDSQRQACLDVIMSETERLGALIDHVLSFSKVENQVKKYNMQPNNIAQVVRDTVSLFKAQMANVQGEIRLKILPGLPSLAVFDKDALREVLLNLLSNAIKYGGAEKFVTVQVGIDQNDLFVEVADRGIGIPADDLSRIFDKFYRVDQELSRNVDGTGLGLAICKEIVQAHGGRIAVSSVLRKGSTFTVYLPYRAPRAGQKRVTATQVAPPRRDTQPVAGEPV